MLKEKRVGVQDIYYLDEKKNLLKAYTGIACSSIFTLCGWGEGPLKEINTLGVKYLRQTFNVKYKNDVPGAISFFKFLFSKEHSPFRHYLKHFEIEYDKHGNPESFICSNLDDVNIDMYVCLSSACRTAYECPGSMQVFDKVLSDTSDPYFAWIMANHFSIPISAGSSRTLDDILHLSRYNAGWHSCFDGNTYNYSLLKRGVQFDNNSFTNPITQYKMNYWFNLRKDGDILFQGKDFTKEEKPNTYKGIFQSYIKKLETDNGKHDKVESYLTFSELNNLYKQRIAA